MPWKTIGSIIILILIILFISFNLGEGFTTNVSLIFTTFENIPVFLVVLISFTLGVLVTLPIAIFARKSRKNKNKDSKKTAETITSETKAAPVYYSEDNLAETQKAETVNNSEIKAEK